jgi:uncharacterized protein YcbX
VTVNTDPHLQLCVLAFFSSQSLFGILTCSTIFLCAFRQSTTIPKKKKANKAQVEKMAITLPALIGLLFLFFVAPIAALLVYLSSTRTTIEAPKGCRRLGLLGRSNISDEQDKKHTLAPFEVGNNEPGIASSESAVKVKALFIYPVKGCEGVELEESQVVRTGLKYDRQFMFAQLKSPFPLSLDATKKEKSAHRWEMINQKQFARMSQIHTEVWIPDSSSPSYSATSDETLGGGVLLLSFPWEEEEGFPGSVQRIKNALGLPKPRMTIHLPLDPTPEYMAKHPFPKEECYIWGDTPISHNLSSLLPPELAYFIGVRNPMSLFRIQTGLERHLTRSVPTDQDLGGRHPTTAFADMHPLHLLAVSSVRDIAQRVQKSIPSFSLRRFRSNIVVSDTSRPFEEDFWHRIKIGDEDYFVSARTPRCTVPNIDPNTGVRHSIEPNKMLRSYRAIDKGAKEACVGVQVVPKAAEGVIRVGDSIEILETGEHVFGE